VKGVTDGPFRIGIISGKLGDVDGVSLEVEKWINVLREFGHEIFTIAGRYVRDLKNVPRDNQILLEKIRFDSPEQRGYEKLVFPHLNRLPPYLSEEGKKEVVKKISAEGQKVANTLFEYIQEYNIDVLIAENTNAMPMTLIGGMAVYELIREKRIATILHHHDFWWERSRFSHNHIESLLSDIMPPSEPGLEHVVLTSYAAHILRSIKRVNPKVIPNCENFEHPVWIDEYNRDFREQMGFHEDDILIVQPTRIVRRKRIEDSIELVGRLVRKYPDLQGKVHFIISLYQGDEPDKGYIEQIEALAQNYEIPLHLISERVSSERGYNEEGQKLYTNRDVLANGDLVTYLPIWEGFGNALLEAIAAKIPVVTSDYLVYKTDIKIVGFENIEIRDIYDEKGRLVIPERAVDEMYYLLTHPREREQLAARNFRIGKKEFGFAALKKHIRNVMDDYTPEILASRKRIEKSKIPYSV
jgi:glycosyltransferase involved in cell wall biosynthesis